MKRLKSPWFKLLILVVLVAVIVIAIRQLDIDFSQVTEEAFEEKVDSFGLWGPIIYIIVYVLRPLVLFPAGVLSASAGLIWGPVKGFLILQVAANTSAIVEFLIARHFARSGIERFLKGKMLNLDEKIEKHGFLTVLLVRLIPNVPLHIQNLSLGLTKVKFRNYFLATIIGIMPGSFAFVFFGASLIKVLFDPGNLWWIVVAVAVFGIVYLLQRYLRKRQTQKNKRG